MVKVRDGFLTLPMWALLVLILPSELRVAGEAIEAGRGRSDAEIDLALAEFLRRLRPLMLPVGALVAALAALAARAPTP